MIKTNSEIGTKSTPKKNKQTNKSNKQVNQQTDHKRSHLYLAHTYGDFDT